MVNAGNTRSGLGCGRSIKACKGVASRERTLQFKAHSIQRNGTLVITEHNDTKVTFLIGLIILFIPSPTRYMRCSGLLGSKNHCVEKLSCDFAAASDSKKAKKLEREVSAM